MQNVIMQTIGSFDIAPKKDPAKEGCPSSHMLNTPLTETD